MLAYTYKEQGKFVLEEKEKPMLQDEQDAIVRATMASICSSDLHIKHGAVPRAVSGITTNIGGKDHDFNRGRIAFLIANMYKI